jgi:formylglycine-generating enzyme required for sulfatase activity
VHEEPQHRRDPISRSWSVSYVRLLGTLEIEVTDAGDGASRILDLSEVQGFRGKAWAACVALLLQLGKGRTPRQLGVAMEGIPRKPSALESHVSAVRRAGFTVSLRSGTYSIDGLDRSRVDALRFADLHHEMSGLRSAQDEAASEELIRKAEEALPLYAGDPVAAHGGYFQDEISLRQLVNHHEDVQFWYAVALARRGESADLEEAVRLRDEIRVRNPSHHGLSELDDLLRRSGPTLAGNLGSPPRMLAWRPDAPAWLDRYRERLVDLASLVDLRGFRVGMLSSSSLAAVYTPLYAKPRTQERPPAGQRTNAARPSLETVVSHTRNNLVVGDSGSGKSTFLLHLCARYLEDRTFLPFFVDVGSSPAIGEERLDSHDRLPWQILPELLSARFADLGVDVTVADIDALANEAPVVWLVDGLNEIAPAEIRFAFADAISLAARRWPNAKFVVTTTETGLAGYGAPPGFQRVDVDEFRSGDIAFFLDAFIRSYDNDWTEQDRREKLEWLTAELRHSADLRDLAGSPLRLTAMALVYLREDAIPEGPADLLRGAVEWLINKKSGVLRRYVGAPRDLRVAFSELAYQMMVREDVPLSRVGKAWAADVLRPMDCFRGDVRDFLDVAVDDGGLLAPRGPGDLGMHEAFRDYLAASRIASKTDDAAEGWWSELAPHLDDPEWHNVTALVPGALLLLSGKERVDLFFDRLGLSCLGQPLAIRAGRVALGGGILRELGLSGYRRPRSPNWTEAVRSMSDLLADPDDVPLDVRFAAAAAYGVMGDERLVRPDELWLSLPGGSYWMGAQATDTAEQNYDPDAAAWELPVRSVQIESLAIRKFPITVCEYQIFVDDGGYGPGGAQFWTEEGWQWCREQSLTGPADWESQQAVPNSPVTGVSWHESVAYCRWLTELQEDRRFECRLPSELEWEYVARRDLGTTQFRWGDRMHAGNDAEANWAGAFLRRKSPVGIFPASTTDDGVADLFGNVEEWCIDAWEEGNGSAATSRVVRGGSCIRFSRLCRPSYRSRIREDQRYQSVGFRPVRVRVDAEETDQAG